MKLLTACSFSLLSLGLFVADAAEDAPDPKTLERPAEKTSASKPAESPEVKPKETTGLVHVEGKELRYAAQTGLLPIFKEDGTVKASVFYVYYAAVDASGEREAKTAAATRPLTFCFNGGPGSSAVWLHLGGLGPRRVDTLLDGRTPGATAPLVENPNTVLDATDLVFIDPVSTGLSRASKGENEKQFLGVEEDIEAVADFIRLFCSREKRWTSPKFLCGESYGGIRGAGLTQFLQTKHGIYLHGLQIVSGLLNYQTISESSGNDLPYILALPTLSNIAHHHGKLAAPLQADRAQTEADARTFATGDYATALLRGNSLSEGDRKRIAARIAGFLGLSEEQVLEQNLRVNRWQFRKLLLKKEGKVFGAYDARVLADDLTGDSAAPSFDPSADFLRGPVSSSINAYVRETLQFESDHPYRVMAPVPWNFNQYANRFVSMEERLAEALVKNPRLKVLLQVGRSDLVVPQDAMRFSVNQLPLPKSLQGNLRFEEYASGHMMYFHLPDAEKFREDTVRFIRDACK
ncbi:MAG: Carboxypeptidase C (cathepsin A) [Verrucomicrobia bacterium]|nr:MAG: Carboxypeptidase C (cathepsin A) [Verrucomicrobiota bacterium]